MKTPNTTIIRTAVLSSANFLETKAVMKYASWKIISFTVTKRVMSLLLLHNKLQGRFCCPIIIYSQTPNVLLTSLCDPTNTDYIDEIPITGLPTCGLVMNMTNILTAKVVHTVQTSGSQPSSDNCYSKESGNTPSLQ